MKTLNGVTIVTQAEKARPPLKPETVKERLGLYTNKHGDIYAYTAGFFVNVQTGVQMSCTELTIRALDIRPIIATITVEEVQ
jgi:hypothetical protein